MTKHTRFRILKEYKPLLTFLIHWVDGRVTRHFDKNLESAKRSYRSANWCIIKIEEAKEVKSQKS